MRVRLSAFVTTVGVLALPACVHRGALRECTAAPGESECWTSSTATSPRRPRSEVVERIHPGDPCDLVKLERTSFDADGVLIERVLERRRCQVVEQRIVERYDLAGNTLVREVHLDRDHDDSFDERIVTRALLTLEQRAFARAESR